MDPRLQDLQGKAERVTARRAAAPCSWTFYGEKAALRRRHEAVARVAGQYDLNNTYQYVIAREDQHLGWLASAILDLGGTAVRRRAAARRARREGRRGRSRRWCWRTRRRSTRSSPPGGRESPASPTRGTGCMLELMLGEMLEQARLFHQAAGGPRGPARPPHGRRPHARRRAADPLGGVVPLVGIALGSNLGDRRAHLDSAVASLGALLADLRVSRVLETEPVDVVGPQGAVPQRGASAGTSTARPASCWPRSWPSSVSAAASGRTRARRARSTST